MPFSFLLIEGSSLADPSNLFVDPSISNGEFTIPTAPPGTLITASSNGDHVITIDQNVLEDDRSADGSDVGNTLSKPVTIDGVLYPAGARVETDHSAVMQSTSNPDLYFMMGLVSIDNEAVGIIMTAPFSASADAVLAGQQYVPNDALQLVSPADYPTSANWSAFTQGEAFGLGNGYDNDIDYFDAAPGHVDPDLAENTVSGTVGDDLITRAYSGDPEGNVVDGGDALGTFGEGAGSDADSIRAEGGDDTVAAGAGDDTIDGGAGEDVLSGGAGRDTIDGGPGNDTINASGDATPDAGGSSPTTTLHQIGLWTFDNDDPLDDAAVIDNDAELVGDAAPDGNGGITLNGAGDYVRIPNNTDYDLDSATVRVEFELNRVDVEQGIMSRDSQNFDGGGHFTLSSKNDGSLELRWQSDAKSYYIRSDAGTVTAGEDYSVQIAFDNDTGIIEMFLNGASVGTVNAPVTLSGNEEPWTLGASQIYSGDATDAGADGFMNGTIRHFEIWDNALSPEEADAAAGDLISGGEGNDLIAADGGDSVDGGEDARGDDWDILSVEHVASIEYYDDDGNPSALETENGVVTFNDGTTLQFSNIEQVDSAGLTLMPTLDLDNQGTGPAGPGELGSDFTALTLTGAPVTENNGLNVVDDGVGETARYSNVGEIDGVQVDLVGVVIESWRINRDGEDTGRNSNLTFNNRTNDEDGSGTANVLFDGNAHYRIQWSVVESGTDNPISGNFSLLFNDLDGNSRLTNFERLTVSNDAMDSYTLDANTDVLAIDNGDGTTTFQPTDRDPGAPGFDPTNAVQLTFSNTSVIDIVYERFNDGGNVGMDGTFSSDFFSDPATLDTNTDFGNVFTEGQGAVGIAANTSVVNTSGVGASQLTISPQAGSFPDGAAETLTITGTDGSTAVIPLDGADPGAQTVRFDGAEYSVSVIGGDVAITPADGTTVRDDQMEQVLSATTYTNRTNMPDGVSGPDRVFEVTVTNAFGIESAPATATIIVVGDADGIVSGTDAGELIDASYTGDPDNDRIDNSDSTGALSEGVGNNDDSVQAGAGNDTVLSGAGKDTVDGGTGDDSLDGGAGNDRLLGSAGSDTLQGGNGTDTLLGGDDADTFTITDSDEVTNIFGGEGGADEDIADFGEEVSTDGVTVTFAGNEAGTYQYGGGMGGASGTFAEIEAISGTDSADNLDGFSTSNGASLSGNGGDDSIQGGTGDDTLDGGADNDTIFGFGGDDTLYGQSGDDSLDGDAGRDFIDGGIGNDTLTGGAGDDALVGGSGDDDLRGGAGEDTLTGGVDRDRFSELTIGDVIDGGEGGNDFDTLDLSGSAPVGGSTNVVPDALDPESGTVIYRNAAGEVVGQLAYENIENVIPCFTPGTMILTSRGEKDVAQLRVGERVITRDTGIQEIRWIGKRTLSTSALMASPHLRPILIRKGALGQDLPQRDMYVSPQHRVLVSNTRTALYFEAEEVLVAAKHLVYLDGVEQADVDTVTYVHVMFDQHEVILSDGAWSESFQPGDMTLSGMDEDNRNELLAIFPELAMRGGLERYAAARRSLKAREAPLLFG